MKLDFKDKEVLVLGGAGFIGSNLSKDLVDLNAEVTVLDSFHPGCGANEFNLEGIKNEIEFIRGDINDKEILKEAIKDKVYIFNLAGQTSHPYSMENPEEDLKINLQGKLNILEACRRNNTEVKIIFASTRQIYGNQEELPVKETAKLNPPDVNAVHKIAAENYLELYNKVYGLKYISLRLTNTFGPRQLMKKSHQGFIARFIKELLDNNKILLPNDFNTKRDINYVDDVSNAFFLSALSNKNGTYNLGSSEILSILEFAKSLVEVNVKGELIYPQEKKESNIKVNDLYLDYSKIKNDLGWEPKISIKDGIRKTLDFYSEHKQQYW